MEGEKNSNFSHLAATLLQLDEPCTCVFLGNGSSDDKIDGSCLDIGATHHMIGHWEFFSDLGVRSLSSLATPLLWRSKASALSSSRPRHASTGVYYIPGLRNSIINVGQLDENESSVEIEHSVLLIWDRLRLLAKVN